MKNTAAGGGWIDSHGATDASEIISGFDFSQTMGYDSIVWVVYDSSACDHRNPPKFQVGRNLLLDFRVIEVIHNNRPLLVNKTHSHDMLYF